MSKQDIRPQGAEWISHPRNLAKASFTVNDSSTCAAIDTKHFIFGECVHREVALRGVTPFVLMAEEVHAASSGIESLVGLLRKSMIDPDSDNLKLSAYDTENLLGLVQFTAWALHSKCSDVQRWADEHLTAGGAQ